MLARAHICPHPSCGEAGYALRNLVGLTLVCASFVIPGLRLTAGMAEADFFAVLLLTKDFFCISPSDEFALHALRARLLT